MMPAVMLWVLVQAPASEWLGQVTVSTGRVVLERGGEQLAPGSRAGLRPGDRLQTGSDGAAAIVFSGGVFAYLGPATVVELTGGNGPVFRLEAGEIRVLAGAGSRPAIGVAGGTLTMNPGAFRVRLVEGNLRIGAEAGSLRGDFTAQPVLNLSQNQEISRRQEGFDPPQPFSGDGWQLDVQRLMAEALADEMRRRRRAAEPDETAGEQRGADESADDMRRPPGATQNQIASASISAAAVGTSASPGFSASAGLFSDAAQFTLQGQLNGDPGAPFPGNIHLVTAETRYGLPGVDLSAAEQSQIFGGSDAAYFSIGRGAIPPTQVTTSFNTASSPTPRAIAIPAFNAHVIRLDQYGPIDAALDPAGAQNSNVGYAGLLGTQPSAPTIVGTTPLADERARINDGATFALGEFRLRPDGGADNNSFELAVRRSDQDRTIVKDPGGNDALDQVARNPDVAAFDDVPDPRFLPAAPTVKVPKSGSYNAAPTRFSRLNDLRRAGATTILADQLHNYARRTGQTRFVIDGKVIDISGYRR